MKIKELKELLEIFNNEDDLEVHIQDKIVPIITIDNINNKLYLSDGSLCINDPTANLWLSIVKFYKNKNHEKVY